MSHTVILYHTVDSQCILEVILEYMNVIEQSRYDFRDSGNFLNLIMNKRFLFLIVYKKQVSQICINQNDHNKINIRTWLSNKGQALQQESYLF